MVLFDTDFYGYRHSVLPLACHDSMVQRAVSVTSALHLAATMPELRAPAESGRAAVVRKLRNDAASGSATVLNDATWATLLLLIIGDLVTGHKDVLALHELLKTFLHARGDAPPMSALEEFLLYQSKLFNFFATPMLSEAEGVNTLQELADPLIAIEPLAQSSTYQVNVRLLNEAFRRASRIYLHRAQSYLTPGRDFKASEMLEDLRTLLSELDPTSHGAHTLVWPYFIAAAESSTDTHRQFFLKRLKHIEATTGFQNVSVAIGKLPSIWDKHSSERWTAALPQLSTVIM